MMRNDGKRAGIVQNTAGLLILLILLALLPAASAGGEAAEALSYRVEECSLERDGMHLFGELYLPEGAEPLTYDDYEVDYIYYYLEVKDAKFNFE